ncbi:phosphoglycerate mutase-related protein [Scenedesmus sp. NREL 46B-D3]|nr:phosphoglycerate mutase-related protein [Scenedesmus sp. NREL 46B-D3]
MLHARTSPGQRIQQASAHPIGLTSPQRTVRARTMTKNTELVAEIEQQLRQQALNPPHLTVVPFRHHKVLHLIRHGEGYHNVAGRMDHSLYCSPEYLDAHLTEFGWQQAKAVQQHIKASGIQTAVGCFGNHSSKPCNGTPPLMLEYVEQQGKITAHPVVSAEGCPPFVCYELCREHLGVHPCDKRCSVSELAAEYPAVDFSLLSDEEDVLWQQQHRETKEEIKARGLAFMAQVMARPERNIAIVSHSSFLHFMMTNYGGQASTAVQGELHRWFENCEWQLSCAHTDTSQPTAYSSSFDVNKSAA